MSDRSMHLMGYIVAGPTGHHNGSWRHPQSDGLNALSVTRYENLARIFERGLFDGLFIVDYQTIHDASPDRPSIMAKHGGQMCMLEPMQLLACMARVTSHIGLTATMSTSFSHPYHIARAFATLDHLSNGRAGWNIVTSASDREAQAYGRSEMMAKDLRYDYAAEVVEACIALWDSWQPDAIEANRETGVYVDSEKINFVEYQGTMVQTRGPFTTPRPPQGRPVLMQAGASEKGKDFAARWAEVIFTLKGDKAVMQNFYAEMKGLVAAKGRSPNDCRILPAIDIFIGSSDAEAHQQANDLDELASYEVALRALSAMADRDLTSYPLDTPLDEIEMGPRAIVGAFQNVKAMISTQNMTLRQAAMKQATTSMTPRLIGTAVAVAAQMIDLFESECCDGFVISPSLSPVMNERFVDEVVPELQRRGVYRTAYPGKTFREHLRG